MRRNRNRRGSRPEPQPGENQGSSPIERPETPSNQPTGEQEINLTPETPRPVDLRVAGRGLTERRFLIDAEQIKYNIPAALNLNVSITDPANSRRPVQLSIQSIPVTIRAVDVNPLLALIKLMNSSVERTNKQLDLLFEMIGELEQKEDSDEKETIIRILKEIPQKAAIEASQEIVGESWFRFNSTTRFYPTLIFHFKEKDVSILGKRTQIKVRWTEIEENREFTTEMRKEIEQRLEIFSQSNLVYNSGPIRANYVSLHPSRWKTTIFVSSQAEAIGVLQPILQTIGERFESSQLSFTVGRKHSPATRVSIEYQPSRAPEWERCCIMYLHRVMLLVNGANKLIEVFHFKQ